jgi:hypothetical protein
MFAIPRRPDASETIFGDRLAAATRQYATKTPTVRLVRSTPKGGRPRRGSRRALDGGQAPILGLFQHYRPKAVQRHVRSHLASAAARQREVLEQLGGTRWQGQMGFTSHRQAFRVWRYGLKRHFVGAIPILARS